MLSWHSWNHNWYKLPNKTLGTLGNADRFQVFVRKLPSPWIEVSVVSLSMNIGSDLHDKPCCYSRHSLLQAACSLEMLCSFS